MKTLIRDDGGPFLEELAQWQVGHFTFGFNSVYVRLRFRGKEYIRHDNGKSWIPRWIRIGVAIKAIENEAGIHKAHEDCLRRCNMILNAA